jgi:two-component system, NtrC family, sensor kinase
MRTLGLRPQLLLLLGGLLVLAFLPLQLALATYTIVTLRQVDDAQARSLGHTFGAYVRQIARAHDPAWLISELERGAPESELVAASASDTSGVQAAFGDRQTLRALREASRAGDSWPRTLRVGERRLWALEVSADGLVTWLAIDAERASSRGKTLIGMFGLYAFLIAVSLLVTAYFALTRLIVRPLDELSRAAQNVTLGSRKLTAPASGVRELGELGLSLTRMTDTLLAEEQSLRGKIAEVERATAELESTQAQLLRSERLASLGRLSAGLAHEIGNPIAAMMGLSDLLLCGDLAANEQRDFIKRIRSEMERVHRTLEGLLDFARPRREPGRELTPSGDVEAAIHDTAALVVHQASLHAIELAIDVFPGLPRVTLASAQLGQVVLNLILNAADALQGRPGGRIAVRAREGAAGVLLEVEDNGPGVPRDVAEHIFEPFFTTKEVGKGTGLGLSVCQGLVSAAGGVLSLDTAYSGGARFLLTLPLADAPEGSPT